MVMNNRRDGIECPCCDRYVKEYKKKMNSGMAYALILLHRAWLPDKPEWLHVRNVLLANKFHNGDYGYFTHWGVLESKRSIKSDGNSSGLFRITVTGIAFVRNQIELPRHIIIDDNVLQEFGDEKTTIKEALGDEFNYDELMRA